MLALWLTTVLMLTPTTYALSVSVVSDHIGDEFIMDIFTGNIVKYVDRRDTDHIPFVDLINVRIRLTEESLLVTLHVWGKIPTDSTEDVNFGFGIMAAPSEDSFKEPFAPAEYPWFAVVVGYLPEPAPGWVSWLYVAMRPDDAYGYFDIPFNIKMKQAAISVSTSLLPMTTFCWRGFTTYQNTTLRDNHKALHDFTNINCLV